MNAYAIATLGNVRNILSLVTVLIILIVDFIALVDEHNVLFLA